MKLTLLQINSAGSLVKNWQFFLTGQQFFNDVADGTFNLLTKNATINFQQRNGLQPDGIVGNKTWGMAMQLGFSAVEDLRTETTSENFPAAPRFSPLVNTKERQRIFGTFAFEPKPLTGNPEHIVITDNWQRENIITVRVPQLKKVIGHDRVSFHRLAAEQLKSLWADWEKAGLLQFIFTWNGSFVPRFIRGSRTVLSNHAFGSAFDINAAFNPLGAMPPLVGQKGCVRELVRIANEHAFYWGGHFTRRDGMHFEVAKLRR